MSLKHLLKISNKDREELTAMLLDFQNSGKSFLTFDNWEDIQSNFARHYDSFENDIKIRTIHIKKAIPTQSGVRISQILDILSSNISRTPSGDYMEAMIDEDKQYLLHGHHRYWIMKQTGVSKVRIKTFDVTNNPYKYLIYEKKKPEEYLYTVAETSVDRYVDIRIPISAAPGNRAFDSKSDAIAYAKMLRSEGESVSVYYLTELDLSSEAKKAKDGYGYVITKSQAGWIAEKVW